MLGIVLDYLQVIAYPFCFVAGALWASRPKDVYNEAGWRFEEYQPKENQSWH